MISLAEMASKTKSLNYGHAMVSLDVGTVREMEDLIMDCMYNGLIKGKID